MTKKTNLKYRLGLAVLAVTSFHASAQQDDASAKRTGMLEEVIVTAQKRTQSLQDVPAAIAAFSENDLKNAGIQRANDIASVVTNVQLNSAGGNGNQAITIRGIGLNDFNLNSTPTAAVHIDEVALGSNAMTNFAVFDLERVEVLKGPQGTLFGRNSTAGVINFIIQKPTEELEGYVNLTLGNYSTNNFEGAVSGPITENLLYRISYKNDTTDEGFQKNNSPDVNWSENGAVDRWAGRVQLAYEGEKFRANFKYHAGEDSSDPWLPQAEGLYDGAGGLCASGLEGKPNPNECFIGGLFGLDYQGISDTDGDVHSGEYNSKPSADDEFSGYALRLELDTDAGTFVALTGVDEMTYRHKTDLDGVGYVDYQEIAGILAPDAALYGLDPAGTQAIADTPAFAQGSILNQFEDFEIEAFSQEIRFTSVGGERFNYLAGVFFSKDDIENKTGYQSDGFSLFLGLPLAGAVYNHEFEQESTSFAVFGQADYAITDNTTITFGARQTWDEREFVNASYGEHPDMEAFLDAAFGVPNSPTLPILPDLFGFGLDMNLPTSNLDGYKAQLVDGGTRLKQEVEFEDLSWKLVLDHAMNEDWMVYGSVSSGYKAGGFPGLIQTAGLFESTPYQDETIMAYEFGSKLVAFDNRLHLNAALFYYDYSDLQGTYATAVGFDRLKTVGDAEVIGLELDGKWLVTDSLLWKFGLAFLDSEVVDAVDDAVDFSGTNPSAPDGLFEGNELAHAPGVTANTSLNYEATLSDAMYMTVQGNLSYKSDYYTRYDGTDISHWDKSSVEVGFRITLNDTNDAWQVAAWGKNITDEEYVTYQSFSLDKGDQFRFYNAPATYGIDFTYRFGG
jgi:iron complex outermembrane receptor protein